MFVRTFTPCHNKSKFTSADLSKIKKQLKQARKSKMSIKQKDQTKDEPPVAQAGPKLSPPTSFYQQAKLKYTPIRSKLPNISQLSNKLQETDPFEEEEDEDNFSSIQEDSTIFECASMIYSIRTKELAKKKSIREIRWGGDVTKKIAIVVRIKVRLFEGRLHTKKLLEVFNDEHMENLDLLFILSKPAYWQDILSHFTHSRFTLRETLCIYYTSTSTTTKYAHANKLEKEHLFTYSEDLIFMFTNDNTFDKRVNFQSSNDIIFLLTRDYNQVPETLKLLSKELYYHKHVNFVNHLLVVNSTRVAKYVTPSQVSDNHFENLSTKDVAPILIKDNIHDLPPEFKEIGLGEQTEPGKDEEHELKVILGQQMDYIKDKITEEEN
eukprot:augustus_masked-scaffold_26-processed-gene-0.10-mRNA-1 protein AED:1.00 eAED:1.00 QI:0/0/0/0/1/1/4/0/379